MEAVKEKLIGAINLMSLEDATSLWEYVINSRTSRTSLNSVEETEPTDDELKILDAYENGDEAYQPYLSHEALKKELGLL